ncbi:hypothetical protein O0882_04395 [Janthinobacterium sp. SUN073]|uniref:hypothetical protein n=1 Tax=Janthinobacterium sp. SUN073 TaxID=3004102 RepID=UPI0025B22250|nr:hypothetical protein [Janthinobacterium sp. SUN073]MDN2695552.1 hypothetical protein [Janthinobacterium sp. SUN073]
MSETVNEVCINAACGRTLPLRVAHCPFCGARQVAAAPVVEKVAAPTPPPPPRMPPPVPVAPSVPAPQAAPQPAPAPQPVPPPAAAAAPAPAKAPPAKPAIKGSVPPPRPPVRLRTWIAAAVVLTGIWFYNKPADKPASVAEQVEAATALAAQCDLDGARSALAVLKSARAPAAQIKRLQANITKSAATCEKQQQRAQAWTGLQDSVNQALDAGKPDVAATRLAIHVKRWGDDPDTLELDAKVKVALASAQLDLADACLAKSDRVCLENSLIAAERYKRPELAARTQALRTALSQLLERSLLDAVPTPAPAPAPGQ